MVYLKSGISHHELNLLRRLITDPFNALTDSDREGLGVVADYLQGELSAQVLRDAESGEYMLTVPVTYDRDALDELACESDTFTPEAVTLTVPRTWRERLFSWPWRPHHNEHVYTGAASFSFSPLLEGQPATSEVILNGPIRHYTRRRSKKGKGTDQ